MAKLKNATTAIKPKKNNSVKIKMIADLVVGVIALIILFNIFNFANTNANRIGLHYNNSVIKNKKFKSIIPPDSTNKLIGPNDTVYTYPIDQRSYIIGGDGTDTDTDDEITIVNKNNIQLDVRVQIYFTLNRNKNVLKSFHERIDLKTKTYKKHN